MIYEFFFGSDLAKKLPLEVKPHSFDSPHTKTYLLLQAHFSRLPLPSSDYFTDTKSVLDQAIRILQVSSSVHCLQCLYNEEAVSFFLSCFLHCAAAFRCCRRCSSLDSLQFPHSPLPAPRPLLPTPHYPLSLPTPGSQTIYSI